jgi:hypothetical protein
VLRPLLWRIWASLGRVGPSESSSPCSETEKGFKEFDRVFMLRDPKG